MTLSEKIASVNKLERIDSSIESCIKILEQELDNRKVEAKDWQEYIHRMQKSLRFFRDDFNIMKGKK